MAHKIFKSISIKRRDGTIVISGADISYAELFGRYIEGGGDLRGLDHTGRDLSEMRLPIGADMTGSDFTGATLSYISAPMAIFHRCVFNHTDAFSMHAARAEFDGSDIFDSKFKRSIIKRGRFRRIQAIKSDFSDMFIQYGDFDTARIDECDFTDTEAHFSRWTGAAAEKCDFTRMKFVPHRWAGNRGGKLLRAHMASNQSNRASFSDAFRQSFSRSRFVGCRYDGASMPPSSVNDFPGDYTMAKTIAGGIGFASIALLVSLDEGANGAIRHLMEIPGVKEAVGQAAQRVSSNYGVAVIGVMGALAIAKANDAIKDRATEVVGVVSQKLFSQERVFQRNIVGKAGDLADMVMLVGSARSMRPVRAAMIASSVNWQRGVDNTPGPDGKPCRKKSRLLYKRRFWTASFDKAKIVVCNKEHAKDALTILAIMHGLHRGHIERQMIFMPVRRHHEQGGGLAAVSVSPKHEMRAVWEIEDEDWHGCVSILWDGNGRYVQADCVPDLPYARKKRLFTDHPELVVVQKADYRDILGSVIDDAVGRNGFSAEVVDNLNAAVANNAYVASKDGGIIQAPSPIAEALHEWEFSEIAGEHLLGIGAHPTAGEVERRFEKSDEFVSDDNGVWPPVFVARRHRAAGDNGMEAQLALEVAAYPPPGG